MYRKRCFRISVAVLLSIGACYWITEKVDYLGLIPGYRGNEETIRALYYESDAEQRFADRKRRLNDACTKFGNHRNVPGDVIYKKNKYLSKSLFYTDKWKILMCLIPKCASRSQATFLGTSEGFGQQAIKHAYEIAEKHLSPRTAKTIKEVAVRINEYTKIVIVREPFSRLLSAYRDKIEKGGNGLNYKRNYDRIQRGKKNRNGTISYFDFVEYLVHSNGDPQVNPHWNYYERLCSPCEIDYAYVVHLDTIEEDIKYITSKIGMKNYTFPPSFNAFTDFEKVKTYYSKLPSTLTEELYRKYKRDFHLFGFPPPPQF